MTSRRNENTYGDIFLQYLYEVSKEVADDQNEFKKMDRSIIQRIEIKKTSICRIGSSRKAFQD
jgi:hypothetical protein